MRCFKETIGKTCHVSGLGLGGFKEAIGVVLRSELTSGVGWTNMSRFWLGVGMFQRDNWWFCVAYREYLRSKLTSGDGWNKKSRFWLGFGKRHLVEHVTFLARFWEVSKRQLMVF